MCIEWLFLHGLYALFYLPSSPCSVVFRGLVSPVVPMDKRSAPATPPPSQVIAGGVRLPIGSPLAWANHGPNRWGLIKLPKPEYTVTGFLSNLWRRRRHLKRARIPSGRKRRRHFRVMKSGKMVTNPAVSQGLMRRRCSNGSLQSRTYARCSPLWYTRMAVQRRCRMQLRVPLQQFIDIAHQTVQLAPPRERTFFRDFHGRPLWLPLILILQYRPFAVTESTCFLRSWPGLYEKDFSGNGRPKVRRSMPSSVDTPI